MKALAIDSAAACISVTACSQQKKASVILDVGMRQSEKIIPAIEYVLKQVELEAAQLDFIALSGGPGSFTGLRLGFAAAKGLQLSTGCPLYSIPTLKALAAPYSSWPGKVLSAIDAKKDRFYVQFFFRGKEISTSLDIGIEDIAQRIAADDNILIVGPDSTALLERLRDFNPSLHLNRFPCLTTIADTLLSMGSEAFESAEQPLPPCDGPVYLRKSEAEENSL